MNTTTLYSNGEQFVCELKMDAPIPCNLPQMTEIMSMVLSLMYEDADNLQEILYNAQHHKRSQDAEAAVPEGNDASESTGNLYGDTPYDGSLQDTETETSKEAESEEFIDDADDMDTSKEAAENQAAMDLFEKIREMTNPLQDDMVRTFQMLTPNGFAILAETSKRICLTKAFEDFVSPASQTDAHPGVEVFPVKLEKIRNCRNEEITAFCYDSAGSDYSELHLLIPKQESAIPDKFSAIPEYFRPNCCCAKITYDDNLDKNYDDVKDAVEAMLNQKDFSFNFCFDAETVGTTNNQENQEEEDTFEKIIKRINKNRISILPVILETGNALLAKAENVELLFESIPDMAVIPVTRKSICTKDIITDETGDIEVFLYEPGIKSDLYLLVKPDGCLDLNNKFYAIAKNIPATEYQIKYDEITKYRNELEESGMEFLFRNPQLGYKVLRQGGCKGGTEYEKDILYTVPGMAVLHENGIHYAPFTEKGRETCMKWYKNDYRENQLVMVQVREADIVEDKGRCASTGMIVLADKEWE